MAGRPGRVLASLTALACGLSAAAAAAAVAPSLVTVPPLDLRLGAASAAVPESRRWASLPVQADLPGPDQEPPPAPAQPARPAQPGQAPAGPADLITVPPAEVQLQPPVPQTLAGFKPPAARLSGRQPKAAGEAPPEWQITPSIDVSEKFTDNVFLTSPGKRPDFVTTAHPSLAVTGKTRTIDATLNYDGSYDAYGGNARFNGYRQTGLAVLDAQPIERLLSVDLRADISERPTDPTAPTSADQTIAANNRTQVATVSVGPKLEHRLGDWAFGQLSYRHDLTMTQAMGATGAAQGTTADISRGDDGKVEVRGGDNFSRLLWDYSSELQRSASSIGVFSQLTHALSTEYKINGSWGLLAATGLDKVTDPTFDGSTVSGPYYSGGVHWTPFATTSLSVGMGRRYDATNLFIQGEHQLGTRTLLRVSHDTGITTDTLAVAQALAAATRDESGAYVDPFSGAAAAPAASPFTLSNGVFRQTNTNLLVRYTYDREQIGLTGQLADRVALATIVPAGLTALQATALSTSSSSLSVGLTWSHQINELLGASAGINGSDVLKSDAPGGKSLRLGGQLGMSYQMNPSLTGRALYSYVDTQQEGVSPITENMFTVGLRKQF